MFDQTKRKKHMKIKFSKEQFLEKRMTELGFGEGVNKNFAFDVLKKPIEYDDILTLREFILLNCKVLKRSQLLVCNKKGQAMMALSSPHGKIIQDFLAKNNFDKHDWPLLASHTKSREHRDLALIDKEVLKQLSFVDVCQMKKSSETTRCIDKILELRKRPEDKNPLSLENFLQISKEQFSWVYFNRMYPFEVLIKLSASFIRTQKKLEKLGFTETDGPFMAIPPRTFSKKDFQADAATFKVQASGQLDLGFPVPKEILMKSGDESAMVG